MNGTELSDQRRLAAGGSRQAALLLKQYYRGKDPVQEYKYACYSALAGDLQSAIELYERGLQVPKGFADYFGYLDDDFVPERMEMVGTSSYLFGHTKNRKNIDYGKP